MNNYIHANIKRVLHKNAFYVTTLVFISLSFIMLYIKSSPNYTSDMYTNDINSLNFFYPLLIGTSIFIVTFHDDFKAKTVQSALGLGITKNQIVLAKVIETIILSVILGFIITITIIILPLVFQIDTQLSTYKYIITTFTAVTLKVFIYFCLCLPILFYRYSATEGVIFFVMLASGFINIFASQLLSSSAVTQLIGDLTGLVLSNAITNLKSSILLNQNIDGISILVIVLHTVLPIGLAMVLFRKKELEF